MKVLISVTPNLTNQIPPEAAINLLRASGDVLRSQLNSGQLDCTYSTGQNTGFGIADVATIEQAWELVAANPLLPFWNVEVTALADPIALFGLQIRTLEAIASPPAPV